MAATESIGVCRICPGSCTLILSHDSNGRITGARGDRNNPVTQGYACIKGLNLHEAHYSPERLLRPLKRAADGSFASIPLDQALDEIAARLARIIERDGPDAVAVFKGTLSYLNVAAAHMLPAFLDALGSKSLFSTMTIDQSAKWVTAERLGSWEAGKDPFDVADVLMFIGANPLMSLTAFNFPMQSPSKAMRAARARGMRIVVIDPRRSETARHADVHLQPVPGEDPTILAGLLRMILAEGWHDANFCGRWAAGLDRLRSAVEPFTADYVARRAGVAAEDLYRAAAVFARPVDGRRPRGSAAGATGPSMAPHSNLADHLIECLNVVCGRFARPGDRIMNPGVIGARRARRAQVVAPARSWEKGWRSRVGGACGGFGMLRGEKMSGCLPDEITTPGAGRIRALLVSGGNPVAAIPGQRNAIAAFRDLELLVTIDPFMTGTARLSHYVFGAADDVRTRRDQQPRQRTMGEISAVCDAHRSAHRASPWLRGCRRLAHAMVHREAHEADDPLRRRRARHAKSAEYRRSVHHSDAQQLGIIPGTAPPSRRGAVRGRAATRGAG